MGRGKKGKGFKMKGHTLPGINQKLDNHPTNLAEQGLSGSSAFQQKSALKNYNNPKEYKVFNWGNEPDGPFKQEQSDLREWLLSEEMGFSQEEADQMIKTGAYTTKNKDFLKWYADSGRGDEPAETPQKKEKIGKDPKPSY